VDELRIPGLVAEDHLGLTSLQTIMMRATSAPVLRCSATLLFLAVVGVFSANAQSSSAVRQLSDDLCGCIEKLDPRTTDATLDSGVRRCLEDAVVYHPGTVHALIQREQGAGTRAFHLGRSLGTLLDRDCSSFQVIKARLQQLRGAGSLKKGTT
jgi:hypothetical protein